MNPSTVTHFSAQDELPLDPNREMVRVYQAVAESEWLHWNTSFRKVRLLGKGGQGTVYLGERQGADFFVLPIALKVFSPESYRDDESYRADMENIGRTASRVALIQDDNLLDIHNFIEENGIRIMEMEWVDGFDLREILTPTFFERSRQQLPRERWDYVHQVILTEGVKQPRLKPGVAIQILRDCLGALSALHREGIVHGDLKPSNIMVKRTGSAKIIDIGSNTVIGKPQARRLWSPQYAAPEVLQGAENSPQSDLASLGYVLIEMLAGQSPFSDRADISHLLEAKKTLEKNLSQLLPREVSSNDLLMHLVRRLIALDPARRFASAQAAELDRKGAADFHRQLVKSDLASEYENDLQSWLENLA